MNPEGEVAQPIGDCERALPSLQRLAEIADDPKVHSRGEEGSAEPVLIAELHRDTLGFAERLERSVVLAEHPEANLQAKPEVDARLGRLLTLRKVVQRQDRVVEGGNTLPQCPAGDSFLSGLAGVVEGLLPALAAKSVAGERLQVLG